jgi:hypothetical protein
MEQFSIQKWPAVVIKYHKRARRGKYDCQPAEILGENGSPNAQFPRQPPAGRAARRGDGNRLSGPN